MCLCTGAILVQFAPTFVLTRVIGAIVSTIVGQGVNVLLVGQILL